MSLAGNIAQGYFSFPSTFNTYGLDVLSSSTMNSQSYYTFQVTLAYVTGEIGLLRRSFILLSIPVREAFTLDSS